MSRYDRTRTKTLTTNTQEKRTMTDFNAIQDALINCDPDKLTELVNTALAQDELVCILGD